MKEVTDQRWMIFPLNTGYPPNILPEITDPWAIPIDSKGIVRRKKLRSNVEISSTCTVVVCPMCSQARKLGVRSHCHTCNNQGRVVMVYSIQVSQRGKWGRTNQK
jgi:hypothetical protein